MNFHLEQMMFLEYMKHLLPDINFYHMAYALLSLLNTLAVAGLYLAFSCRIVAEKSTLMKRISLASWRCSDGGVEVHWDSLFLLSQCLSTPTRSLQYIWEEWTSSAKLSLGLGKLIQLR